MERVVTFDAGRDVPSTAEEIWSMHVLYSGSPAGGPGGKAVLRRHVCHGRFGNLFTEEFRFGIDELRAMVPEGEMGPGPGREGCRP